MEINVILYEFKVWLALLNYESSTVKYAPKKVSELLEFLSIRDLDGIRNLTNKQMNLFFHHLENRPNKRSGQKLKSNYLRTYITAIRKFLNFLLKNKGISLVFNYSISKSSLSTKLYFSEKQIRNLYKAAGSGIIGMRDKAMLAIYYGCGLRRSEGSKIKICDFDFYSCTLHVRNGKNYKERYVPIAYDALKEIGRYLEVSRPELCISKNDYFFLSKNGNPMSGESLAGRFAKLKKAAGIEQKGGLHSLRHSIATHLFKHGVDIDIIRRFLGHSTLQNTQIYTHYN